MKYCSRCVQPDTRPGLVFGDDGVCMACRLRDDRQKVDWDERKRQLLEIADWARETADGDFECVVGVSGGKDSHFQAFYARERLGLKVLLVNCAPDAITEVGRRNLENLVQHGFDMVSFRPNPRVMRAVTRRSFFEHGNPVKPSEYPLYAVSYQAALRFNIPLIVQGENPGITLGIVGFLGTTDDALNIRHHNTLGGGNAADWVQEGIGLDDLRFYQFPDDGELRDSVRAIHLNYYAEEWSNAGNTKFAVAHGLCGRPGHDPNLTGRLNPYSSVDSDMQIVNQLLKYYKFGFGSVTDETCYNIREGLLSRDEAIGLVKLYDGKCDESYVREFCQYIDVTAEEFWQTADRFVNRELFSRNPTTGMWEPLFEVGRNLDAGGTS